VERVYSLKARIASLEIAEVVGLSPVDKVPIREVKALLGELFTPAEVHKESDLAFYTDPVDTIPKLLGL